MKRVHLLAVAALALAALIGCGGGGESNNNNTGATGGLTGGLPGDARIEAIVVVDRSNLKDPSKYTDAQLHDPTKVNPNDLINPTLFGVQDPMNIQTQEQYYFQLVSYSTGQRVILNDGVTWGTSDPSGQYGNIGSNSGLFLAGSNVNQTDQFVFAFVGPQRFEIQYSIRPRQVRLLGKVLDEVSGKPVPNVTLFFFDNFNTLVGTVNSSFDGSFRASVPDNTMTFSPTVESIPVNYYQSFLFAGLRYTVGFPQCKASLPSLTQGTFVLSDPIYLRTRVAGQSTPPPTGCTL